MQRKAVVDDIMSCKYSHMPDDHVRGVARDGREQKKTGTRPGGIALMFAFPSRNLFDRCRVDADAMQQQHQVLGSYKKAIIGPKNHQSQESNCFIASRDQKPGKNMNFKLFVLTCLAVVAAFALAVEANGTLPLMLAVQRSRSRMVRAGASCQLYGHSCLGGHGKRSDSSADMTADAGSSFPARVAGQRLNGLLQRMLARRISPDLLAAYMASSSELADMDKRSADYMQS